MYLLVWMTRNAGTSSLFCQLKAQGVLPDPLGFQHWQPWYLWLDRLHFEPFGLYQKCQLLHLRIHNFISHNVSNSKSHPNFFLLTETLKSKCIAFNYMHFLHLCLIPTKYLHKCNSSMSFAGSPHRPFLLLIWRDFMGTSCRKLIDW